MSKRYRTDTKATPRKGQGLRKWVWGTMPILVLLLVSVGWLLGQNRKPASTVATDMPTAVAPEGSRKTTGNVVAEITAEIIPAEGTETSYGIPLSLHNTRRFLDYYSAAALTPEQDKAMRDALLPLRAPCCDDNSMATCCCPCNLAKAVWGLSGYLVAEKAYRVEQVREAALEWLRFIHSDYYIIQEMKNRGIDPALYGLHHENPCYVGKCELPFREGGCGGMAELRE